MVFHEWSSFALLSTAKFSNSYCRITIYIERICNLTVSVDERLGFYFISMENVTICIFPQQESIKILKNSIKKKSTQTKMIP